MVKKYKQGQDIRTSQIDVVKEAKKHTTKMVGTVKVEHSSKATERRTIKDAPKIGSVSRTSIKKAVKTVSSSRKKKSHDSK